MIRLGVTGTDTGVGKTVIAASLIAALRQRGLRVAAMKPVETGAITGPGDATRLRAAAGDIDPLADVCPISFPEPLAPLVAGQRSGRMIALETLDAAFARLSLGREAIVVEGAGGLLVPLTERASYADLFARWRLGTVVVAANRLGALNHVRLTVQAARAAGLEIVAVVLNAATRPVADDLPAATNGRTLERLLPDVPLVSWPWIPDPADDRALVASAEQSGLTALCAGAAARRPELSLGTP